MNINDRNKLAGIKYKELYGLIADDQQIGQFLALLRRQPNFARVSDEAAALEEDYNRMGDFLIEGYPDKDREVLFEQMLARAYAILQNLYLFNWLNSPLMRSYAAYANVPIEMENLKAALENHVQDVAMLQLEAPEMAARKKVELFEKHYALMERAFCSIAFSRQWSAEQSRQMAALLVSPTIDTIDAQLLVGALYVAVTNVPDAEKLRALMQIYRETTDDAVRQRALVALSFGASEDCQPFAPRHLLREELRKFFSHRSVAQQLGGIILLVAMCEQTGKGGGEAMKKMSSLFGSISFSMMNQPTEEDKLNNILHPEQEEQKMEQMSDNLEKLKDMMEQGVDIYFQGFKHLKRAHFFYTLSNWFVPYYPEHPELRDINPELAKSKIFEKLGDKSPFCDSDKYSFVISLGQVFNQLPKEVRDATMMGEIGPVPDTVGDTATNLRRSILQDLYRFHQLHPSKSAFFSPFTTENLCNTFGELLEDTTGAQCMRDAALQLSDRGFHREAISLYSLGTELNIPHQHYELGLLYYRAGDYIEADAELGKANLDDPDNEEVNRLYAKAAYKTGDIDTAGTLLEALCEKYPDDVPLGLMLGKVYYFRQEYKEAAALLYKYYYMNPGEPEVMRYLGISLICDRQSEKALRILDELTANSKNQPEDFFLKGLAQWLTGNRKGTVNSFAKYLQAKRPGSSIAALKAEFRPYKNLLEESGIGKLEISIIFDRACSRYRTLIGGGDRK
ncbi:MAG: tetratricopeptide repeat protein [Prevotella sp.]|jgi:Flp pilus assembly protein TadD